MSRWSIFPLSLQPEFGHCFIFFGIVLLQSRLIITTSNYQWWLSDTLPPAAGSCWFWWPRQHWHLPQRLCFQKQPGHTTIIRAAAAHKYHCRRQYYYSCITRKISTTKLSETMQVVWWLKIWHGEWNSYGWKNKTNSDFWKPKHAFYRTRNVCTQNRPAWWTRRAFMKRYYWIPSLSSRSVEEYFGWNICSLRFLPITQLNQFFFFVCSILLFLSTGRKWVQAWGQRWETKEDWQEWISMGEKRNPYIPSAPDEYYGRLGTWVSWDHFLLEPPKEDDDAQTTSDDQDTS